MLVDNDPSRCDSLEKQEMVTITALLQKQVTYVRIDGPWTWSPSLTSAVGFVVPLRIHALQIGLGPCIKLVFSCMSEDELTSFSSVPASVLTILGYQMTLKSGVGQVHITDFTEMAET